MHQLYISKQKQTFAQQYTHMMYWYVWSQHPVSGICTYLCVHPCEMGLELTALCLWLCTACIYHSHAVVLFHSWFNATKHFVYPRQITVCIYIHHMINTAWSHCKANHLQLLCASKHALPFTPNVSWSISCIRGGLGCICTCMIILLMIYLKMGGFCNTQAQTAPEQWKIV